MGKWGGSKSVRCPCGNFSKTAAIFRLSAHMQLVTSFRSDTTTDRDQRDDDNIVKLSWR